MRCPKCGKDVELQNRQVGVDDNGEPILNEYAVCKDCKKQWNLDKQRAKKASAPNHTQPDEKNTGKVKSNPATINNSASKKQIQQSVKKTPSVKKSTSETVSDTAKSNETQKYSNIPPERIRAKKEKAVRQNYEEMLALDPKKKNTKRKSAPSGQSVSSSKKANTSSRAAVQKKSAPQPMKKTDKTELKPKFKLLRVILGIISIIAFGLFAYRGFLTGLKNITDGSNSTTGTTYIVLALCMLITGMLLLIMQSKHTILAFILPMLFTLGGAVFSFLQRGDDMLLLFGAIVFAILGIVFLILAIASRSEQSDDDYDDPFDDDHDN
jgi:hypothetical protein